MGACSSRGGGGRRESPVADPGSVVLDDTKHQEQLRAASPAAATAAPATAVAAAASSSAAPAAPATAAAAAPSSAAAEKLEPVAVEEAKPIMIGMVDARAPKAKIEGPAARLKELQSKGDLTKKEKAELRKLSLIHI